MITEELICTFIEQCLQYIRNSLPKELHTWSPTKVNRSESGVGFSVGDKLSTSTIQGLYGVIHPMPPFFEETMLQRGVILRILDIATSILSRLEDDSHYKEIPAKNREDFSVKAVGFRIIKDYLIHCTSLNYDEKLANCIAANFINSLRGKEAKYVLYTVLKGFQSDIEPIVLEDNLQIRKLEDDEIGRLVDTNPCLIDDNPAMHCYMIEYRFRIPIYEQAMFEPGSIYNTYFATAKEKFDTIITALWLLKEGRVSYRAIFVREENIGQFKIMFAFPADNQRDSFLGSYSLLEQETTNLQELYTKLSSPKFGKDISPLPFAISRFNCAMKRKESNDKIVDLMIAMESLFSIDSKDGMIGYKVALRCARFIGENFLARNRLFVAINKLYTLRSKIVHGANNNVSSDDIRELEDIVRRSISKFTGIMSHFKGVFK